MVIWGMMTWWYTAGWLQCLLRVKNRIASTVDYFSIGLLIKTVVSPFRQISAGSVRGSFEVQMRAFFDQLISRVIGAMVRLATIVAGSLVILFNIIVGGLFLVTWLVVPFLPLAGLLLFAIGWVPWAS